MTWNTSSVVLPYNLYPSSINCSAFRGTEIWLIKNSKKPLYKCVLVSRAGESLAFFLKCSRFFKTDGFLKKSYSPSESSAFHVIRGQEGEKYGNKKKGQFHDAEPITHIESMNRLC